MRLRVGTRLVLLAATILWTACADALPPPNSPEAGTRDYDGAVGGKVSRGKTVQVSSLPEAGPAPTPPAGTTLQGEVVGLPCGADSSCDSYPPLVGVRVEITRGSSFMLRVTTLSHGVFFARLPSGLYQLDVVDAPSPIDVGGCTSARVEVGARTGASVLLACPYRT